MQVEFTGKIWYWRGPSPYYFVTMPEEQSLAIRSIAHFVTYGWGVIPVQAQIGATVWKTSLIPKNGRYLVPLRDNVRQAEGLGTGDTVTVQLELRL